MKYDIEKYNKTAVDIAGLFNWTPDHVRWLARTNQIPCIKRRRQWFFCKEELIKLYNGLTYTPINQTEEETNERRDDEECDIFS